MIICKYINILLIVFIVFYDIYIKKSPPQVKTRGAGNRKQVNPML